MVLTGRRVSAAEAYFMGIADRLVQVLPNEEDGGEDRDGDAKGREEWMSRAKDKVLTEAVRIAREICIGGPVAVRSALRAVGYAREEVENEMYERVVRTEDRNEALVAFREKRQPVFKGR